MALVEILYSEIYEKLSEYNSKLRQNRFKMEAAFSAYDAKSSANDRQLKLALSENAHGQSKLEAELALLGMSLNDKNMLTKYNEVSGRLKALKEEAGKLKNAFEIKKYELDREFKSNENRLMNELGKLKVQVKEYLDSPEFKRFAFIVNSDKALFDNAMEHEADSLNGSDYISIGILRAPIPVHEEFLTRFTALFNYNFEATIRTINLPLSIDMKKGQSIVVEYDSSTEQEMLSGIRNFILNISRYWGERFNGKREILLFQNFPDNYDAKQIGDIRKLCVEAADNGNIVVLTHNGTVKNQEPADTLTFIKSMSLNIKAKMGKFFVEVNKINEIAAFRWYSSALSKENERTEDVEAPVIQSECVAIYIDNDRTDLLHNIITTMVKNYHPDDVELWLVDFGKYEFSRYVDSIPLHVRYLICDESEQLVFDIIDRLIEVLEKRQDIFKANGWKSYNDVPHEKYMPIIAVMINEFAVISQALSNKRDYTAKFNRLITEGEQLGFRFVFAGNKRLEEYKILDDVSISHILQYGEGKLLLKDMKLSPLCIMDKEEQAELIAAIKMQMTSAAAYDFDDLSLYIDKKTVVIDGSRYVAFNSVRGLIVECIAGKSEYDNGTSLLFLGETRRMDVMCPVRVEREAFENMIIVAANTECEPAASVIMSLFESLKLQNMRFEIWGSVRSSVFKTLQNCMKDEVFTAKNMEDIREQIGAVKKDIMAQKRADRFIVLMGIDALFNISGSAYSVYPGIYDLSADIRFILTYGPHLGYHFILMLNSEFELERCQIPASIFRHKVSFDTKGHFFKYSNEADVVTFKPYLHKGLSWDGWRLADGEAIHVVKMDEYLM